MAATDPRYCQLLGRYTRPVRLVLLTSPRWRFLDYSYLYHLANDNWRPWR